MSASDGLSVETDGRRDDTTLAVRAARLFYFEDRSKSEIAAAMKLSRFKVARLLDRARSEGIVKISVVSPQLTDTLLAHRLRERFGLRHAVVLSVFEADDAALRAHLGQAGADLLGELVNPGETVGFGWARSVLAVAARLRTIAPCRVVQLSGSLSRPEGEFSASELVRRVAHLGGGSALAYHAPMFVSGRRVAETLRAEPQVRNAMQACSEVTTAIVGVGGWSPLASTLAEVVTPAERAAVVASGAYADISGVFVGRDGEPVATPVSDRIVAISADALRAIPDVIAITYGVEKVGPTRAAIRGGYVSGLVTHTTFAERLLAE